MLKTRPRLPTCVATHADGTRCGQPATILDPQRGGLVCERHHPERWRRFCWTEGDLIRLPRDDADEEEAS